ncbi:Peptidase family M23 [Bacteroides ovatus CL03T12C18]|nr:hypothetical protein HMPREF1070_02133 [Bacteroides ovatus CL03T12C18]MBT0713211.1 Peptidase family M23 [Bacteroides ovatus CL03T12C18]TDA85527.1 M23 family metallopeptidase [Phocaeicola dorei]TDA92772.1 M23 family metallopeptidase [Phocaeicola dorei]
MSGITLSVIPVHAQFNTVVTVPARYRVEIIAPDTVEVGKIAGDTVSDRSRTVGDSIPLFPDEALKKEWVERYLSVSYPLRRMKITSPYGYRKDPFTGKKRFHNGIDLHARGEQVLAMMEGVVVKVGQDNASGKYVTLRHGSYTVSYCHLSRVLTRKGAVVRPRDAVGITGSTGRSTGEHLHITCRLDGKSVDPALLLGYVEATQKECVEALAEL